MPKYLEKITVDGVEYRYESFYWTLTGYIDETITELLIPDRIDGKQVCGIESKAFIRHPNLKRVEFPYTMKKIAQFAFADCVHLESARMWATGYDLTVGYAAFSGCHSLTTFDADGVLSVFEYAFKDCHKLSAINCVISAVKSNAFENCNALTGPIKLQDGIYFIWKDSFEGSSLNALRFLGNVSTHILEQRHTNGLSGMKLICPGDSNVTELVHDGFCVEVINGQ